MTYKQTVSRLGVCFLFLMLVTGILQTVASVAVSMLVPGLYETDWFIWVLSYVPLYCIAVPLFLLVGRALLPDNAPAPAGGHKMTPGRWISTVVLCLGVTYAFNILSSMLLTGIGMLKGTPAQNPLDMLVSASGLVWNLLFGCVVAPVGEELIFRKWMYAKLGRFGDKAYVLLGGAVFGLFHGNLSQMFYAAVLGSIFCWMYLRTGSLLVTISLHMTVNVIGMAVMPALAMSEAGTMAAGVLVIVFLIAGGVLAVRGWNRLYWTGGENAPARPLAALATPGMLGYLVICLGMVFISLLS